MTDAGLLILGELLVKVLRQRAAVLTGRALFVAESSVILTDPELDAVNHVLKEAGR